MFCMDFIGFILFGVCSTPRICRFMSSAKFEKCSAIISLKTSQSHLLSPLLLRFDNTRKICITGQSWHTGIGGSLFRKSVSFSVQLDNFHHSTFNFIDFSLCTFLSVFHCTHSLTFSFVVFSSKLLILLLYFLLLFWDFLFFFPFVSNVLIFAHWSIFFMGVLKPLLYDSSMCPIDVGFCCLSIKLRFSCFLVYLMIFYYILDIIIIMLWDCFILKFFLFQQAPLSLHW